MDASLIRFNNNHIFAAELTMANDRLLEAFIHNKREPPIPEICGGGSRESGPLHGNVGEGSEQIRRWLDINQLVGEKFQ
ncbi:hypothetical protein GOBAR_AA40185 [Gossypium barbadense]|uniref:Uncharacterized protein n=1 Tax=Gossypium barbadense TaxID=3634 RepID=A0A2P5VNW1_GOSBA|nr:hypothetical protein GOBAR_AA40185 [Gossypium barbadense]